MKKVLITIVGLMFCAGLMTSNAAGKKQPLTPEQEKAKKELMEKYDTNKDGKLDKSEKSKMTDADKEKLKELQGAAKKKAK